MSNHVHLIAVPEREDSLAPCCARPHACRLYPHGSTSANSETGHLCQNRFYSCPLDHGHCWAALRYVERNPVRAGMVETAWQWPWSSASAHVSAFDGTGLLDLQEWQTCWTGPLWKQALQDGVGEALLAERIRLATRTGRPLGTRDFAAGLEQAMGRSLLPAKRGRKPKDHSAGKRLLSAKE